MGVLLKLRCPDCGIVFRVAQEEGFPNFCPSCGTDQRVPDPSFVPTQLNIGGGAMARSVDSTYRQMEDASIARAEMAGDPSLKITNLRDNLREGEVAAMPVNNIVTQTADAYKAEGFSYFQAAGQASISDTLAMVKAGKERTTGAKALGAIQAAAGAPSPAVPTIKGKWG